MVLRMFKSRSRASVGKDTVLGRFWRRSVTGDAFRRRARADLQTRSQLHDAIILHPAIPSVPKSLSALAMAEADYALCSGADEELQLLETCLRIQAALARA